MSPALKLTAHPRLYIGASQLDRLKRTPDDPILSAAQKAFEDQACSYTRSATFDWTPHTHNGHLMRARRQQGRVVTLALRFIQTGDAKYRKACLDHIHAMSQWDGWSWITWRQNNNQPKAIYDLSYGENSTTLAIVYDLLHDTFSAQEKRLLVGLAKRWSFASFLHHTKPVTEPTGRAWWFGHPDSNWNTVCAGGAGMLALAMAEEFPDDAATVLERVEKSIKPYMRAMDRYDGGWPEGIGYWNYGMRYAFMYLLSHEQATGRPHDLLRKRGTQRSLWFPLDFCPHGVPCSFGDVNHWSPLPFHYAVADKLKVKGLTAALDARRAGRPIGSGGWPDAAELLVLHPRKTTGKPPASAERVRRYRHLDWCVLADRLTDSRLYLTIRGGTTKVPHAHHDLLSFNCVVGSGAEAEAMIVNLGMPEYLDTTFSPRRFEMFDAAACSKNTILINGVGHAHDAHVKTSLVKGAGWQGVLIDASDQMGTMRDGPVARQCLRLFALVRGKVAVVIDRVAVPQVARIESRMYTCADVTWQKSAAVLRGEHQRMRVAYAATADAQLHRSMAAPTTPRRPGGARRGPTEPRAARGPAERAAPANMMRLITDRLVDRVTMATLLSLGAGAASVSVEDDRGGIAVTIKGNDVSAKLPLTAGLRPRKG